MGEKAHWVEWKVKSRKSRNFGTSQTGRGRKGGDSTRDRQGSNHPTGTSRELSRGHHALALLFPIPTAHPVIDWSGTFWMFQLPRQLPQRPVLAACCTVSSLGLPCVFGLGIEIVIRRSAFRLLLLVIRSTEANFKQAIKRARSQK